MKYILDKNILTNDLIDNIHKRYDLCVTQDVLDEGGFTKQEITKIRNAGVQILKVYKLHFEKLKEVLVKHGDNLKLINLYLGVGTADVMMIAFILAERDNAASLFPEKYTIVTKDSELTSVANSYGITCVKALPS
jgi:hypothetical protein